MSAAEILLYFHGKVTNGFLREGGSVILENDNLADLS